MIMEWKFKEKVEVIGWDDDMIVKINVNKKGMANFNKTRKRIIADIRKMVKEKMY